MDVGGQALNLRLRIHILLIMTLVFPAKQMLWGHYPKVIAERSHLNKPGCGHKACLDRPVNELSAVLKFRLEALASNKRYELLNGLECWFLWHGRHTKHYA